MKVMIAAGGTGGHIYPALALAEELKKEKPESEILFFGSSERMEAKLIPEKGYRFYGMSMAVTNGGLLNKVNALRLLVKAERHCIRILQKEQPDICVGFGNYISVPLIRAASRLHIPTLLHEQNSFAGKANKYLSRLADGIVGCYESNRSQMPAEKTRIYGNPQATAAAGTVFDSRNLTEIGLKEDIPFVIFMMGSLGSSSVSAVIDQACPLFDRNFQYVIAAGTANDYTYQTKSDDHIRIVEYVDGKQMLKGCALAVTRAGATTMAEIGAVGTPAVLIPSPYVPNNHQVINAEELVKENAAVMIEAKDLTPELLAETVNSLLNDPGRREEMRKNALRLGKPDASVRIIRWMEELVNEK